MTLSLSEQQCGHSDTRPLSSYHSLGKDFNNSCISNSKERDYVFRSISMEGEPFSHLVFELFKRYALVCVQISRLCALVKKENVVSGWIQWGYTWRKWNWWVKYL